MKEQDHIDSVHEAIEQLSRLTDVFQKRRSQLAGQVGLTEQQWLVLEEISSEHFIPSMFAKNRESSQAAVSKIIRQLIDKDLIVVSINQSDGRQRNYELTKKGKRLMTQLRKIRQQAIDDIWMNLRYRELIAFNKFSKRLIESIENYAGNSGETPPKKE